jgi:hypothetical protein
MSLKVGVQVQIWSMDGTQLLDVAKVDTAINPNPRDPTAEIPLAATLVDRLVSEANADSQQRLQEANEAIARTL